jgi:hydroxymethylbilane synthase
MARERIIIGTRGSKLAVMQTEWVAGRIRGACPGVRVELERIVTTGDKRAKDAIPEIGQKGVFTAELEEALVAGRIDLAVHSAKDLPTETPDELDLLLVPAREDARDALITRDDRLLAGLPVGAVVGTSSLRRQAQLLRRRPDLRFVALRGNVDTRIRKIKDGVCDAGVLALAGLRRAGLSDRVTEVLDADWMVPAPGQGILAVQGRRGDAALREMLARLDDRDARLALDAERWIIERLEGGCRAPIGAWVRRTETGLRADAVVILPDASRVARTTHERTDDDWRTLADATVEALLAQGAAEIIAACRL